MRRCEVPRGGLVRLWLFVAALAVASLGVGHAVAEGAATASVRNANQTLSALLKKKVEPGSAEEKALSKEVTSKLSSFLDVDELGRRAMKDHWDKLTPEQKQEFSKLLRELVESNYVKALRSQLEYDVAYVGESTKDSAVSVATEVRSTKNGRKRTMSIDYVLHQSDSAWRVFDLVTDGVGLVQNYRSQFNKVIAKEGVAGLLERMRKKSLEGKQ
jgi:phospholipid transport system substrate-binding protein